MFARGVCLQFVCGVCEGERRRVKCDPFYLGRAAIDIIKNQAGRPGRAWGLVKAIWVVVCVSACVSVCVCVCVSTCIVSVRMWPGSLMTELASLKSASLQSAIICGECACATEKPACEQLQCVSPTLTQSLHSQIPFCLSLTHLTFPFN